MRCILRIRKLHYVKLSCAEIWKCHFWDTELRLAIMDLHEYC